MILKLKEVREAAGLKQEEVAAALGVKLGTYRSWEQGRRGINGEKLSILADYFGVTADEILGYLPEAVKATDFEALKEKASEYSRKPDFDFEELTCIYMFQLDENERRLLLKIARAIADDE